VSQIAKANKVHVDTNLVGKKAQAFKTAMGERTLDAEVLGASVLPS